MSLNILLLLAVVILVFYIWKKVIDLEHSVEAKIDQLYKTASGPIKTAADITAALLPGHSGSGKGKKSHQTR